MRAVAVLALLLTAAACLPCAAAMRGGRKVTAPRCRRAERRRPLP